MQSNFLGESRREIVYPPQPEPRMTTRSRPECVSGGDTVEADRLEPTALAGLQR